MASQVGEDALEREEAHCSQDVRVEREGDESEGGAGRLKRSVNRQWGVVECVEWDPRACQGRVRWSCSCRDEVDEWEDEDEGEDGRKARRGAGETSFGLEGFCRRSGCAEVLTRELDESRERAGG